MTIEPSIQQSRPYRRRPAAERAPPENERRSPDYSDHALALRFTARHKDELRYCALWGKWLWWDGARWKPEQTNLARELARKICESAAGESGLAVRDADRIKSDNKVRAVEWLAQADRAHAALVEQFDTDPWLLNAPDGTIDLRTGERRPHRREDHITRVTAATSGGDCPTWRAFLRRVTAGDAELEHYLQRVAGYACTGITNEHALFFLYGTGANGKSTFLETLGDALGDYQIKAQVETFMISRNDRHPTDIASLRGARLVTVTETQDGRRWDEAKIKALTGGDKISARYMRQDPFEYTPNFKLVVSGNHKPGINSVDEAMRRRLHLVPFNVTIPEGERDPELRKKLRAELPGILAWAIEGALWWAGEGLRPPAAVRSATEAYLESEDALKRWIEEECDENKGSKTPFTAPVAALFASWKAWAEKSGEHVGSMRRFSQALMERGFEPTRLHGGTRGFKGLLIKPDDDNGARR